jgi:hypothetical protein
LTLLVYINNHAPKLQEEFYQSLEIFRHEKSA